jgi:HK97 gp10 family phage protein
MAKGSVRIDGLKELDEALSQLPRATGKNVLRRIGIRSLAPVISAAKSNVPVYRGDLRDSLKVTTKLSKRQQRENARAVADGKASVQLYAGAAALPHAHLVEFGTATMPPQPFMRPAWDANKDEVLQIIKDELGDEITKAAARLARKTARLAAKG